MRDAGGGVHVARAILALGGNATAVVTTGDNVGASLLRLIERDEIPVRAVDNMVAGITVVLDRGWGLVETVRFGSAA